MVLAKEKSKPLFLRGRRIASVRGQTLHRSLSGASHFLNGDSVAFVVEILYRAKALGASQVEIKDRDEGGKTYVTPLSVFFEKGWELKNSFGDQRVLSLAHFETTGGDRKAKSQPVTLKAIAAPIQREPVRDAQLDLFVAA